MHDLLFWLIITLLSLRFVVNKILDFINNKNLTEELPPKLKDIYDEESYKKSQRYKKDRAKFSNIYDLFSFIAIISMFFFNGFLFIDNIANRFFSNPILVSLSFFLILFILSDILSTPFSIYSTFVIEERYGFNKTDVKTFITDKLKSWLLGAIIGGGLFSLIMWFYMKTQNMFWIYAWAGISLFSLLMSLFYSSLIVPLFNKQKPLPEGDLRDAIEKYSKENGFILNNIYVIDGSKRSTKANAYFTSFGKNKRIVLYDTLLNSMSTEQIIAVLAHEIGHYKKRHTQTALALSIIRSGIMFYILSLLIDFPALYKIFGTEKFGFHLVIIAFSVLFSPISEILDICTNFISRKNEYEADKFSVQTYKKEALYTALCELSKNNLTNLTPHPVYVFMHYSHPPLLKRLEAIEKL